MQLYKFSFLLVCRSVVRLFEKIPLKVTVLPLAVIIVTVVPVETVVTYVKIVTEVTVVTVTVYFFSLDN